MRGKNSAFTQSHTILSVLRLRQKRGLSNMGATHSIQPFTKYT